MVKSSSDIAVLGKGLRVRGHVRGDGDLCVEAQVEGDISVSGVLQLEEGASVNGALQGDSVVVAGVLEGEAIAPNGAVTITATGQLTGDVKAAEFSLEEGGKFSGRVEANFDLPEAIA